MPLTEFQKEVAGIIAPLRSEDSHLAGGAALHNVPNSKRYSNDLDYFHDSVERVGQAFFNDEKALTAAGFSINILMNQPGFIRAIVAKGNQATKIEWSHDSAWRFMPAVKVEGIGYQLDPIDLAVNKLLALAGRDEPRDFLDINFINENILTLGALCWAAVGKDPGFTPVSLLSLIQRRGKYRPEDFERLDLVEPVNLFALKEKWLKALEEAGQFIEQQPFEEAGCLYYSLSDSKFVSPERKNGNLPVDIVCHYGQPGGVLPIIT